ncbi:hypothetical protein EPUS_07429 [Endocarpon pusillum Z07020]|uniref:Uncharacterized protein n=1 Tax=Endocarpon pusillum (strain Z07020 / HMAS-L-300199) TaxID=1263415 RepID=U1GHW1_ENDPU|nr:uncharacterized protein EPUS_07429 [Endocarpon pusillum Z07020]ERF71401.1 hypothetical protein EPUS_07429 [Endocarpon pusillum Z07020]
MGDKRCANHEYAEDVDAMILEYLIYNVTKACIDDFAARNVGENALQASPNVLTQLHVLNDFLHIYRAKYKSKELDEEVRLWMEILELVALVVYRLVKPFPLSTTVTSVAAQRQLAERRQYWLSARQKTSQVTEKESTIYKTLNNFCTQPTTTIENQLPHPTLGSIIPLFFNISARIAIFIDQSMSEQWIELAAQFMLQAALESCLMLDGTVEGGNPLALSFAWGWIPSTYWKDFDSSDKSGIEAELMINDMFADDRGNQSKGDPAWQKARLKYMSLLGSLQSGERLDNRSLVTQLQKITNEYPIREFERKVMVFAQQMWEFCRKPLLVQIEEGRVKGMTECEFEDFKKRIFVQL